MIFVVCLCGGPGVGKSTFAAQLCQEMHIRHVDILKPVIISYDDVAKNILGSHTFKEIRAITLNVMEREFLTAQYNVIILDDTMHYHSMRREVNARVRDLHGVMQTVWLKCDVEIAASRDAGRETPLGNEMVRKVHSVFEVPRDQNIYERNCIVVETTTPASISAGMNVICSAACRTVVKEIKPFSVNSVCRNEDVGQPCRDIHDADLLLRKFVSATIQKLKKACAQRRILVSKAIFEAVNNAKAETFVKIREYYGTISGSVGDRDFFSTPFFQELFLVSLVEHFRADLLVEGEEKDIVDRFLAEMREESLL